MVDEIRQLPVNRLKEEIKELQVSRLFFFFVSCALVVFELIH